MAATRYPGISVFVFRPTGNLHPTASERKVQSGFQCWVLPRTTEGVSVSSWENPKARNCRFSDRFLRHFSFPQPPSSPKSAPVCGSPTPLVMVVPRSCTACLRRAALSDDLRPATASNTGHVSRTGHPSLPPAAANASAISGRFSSAAPPQPHTVIPCGLAGVSSFDQRCEQYGTDTRIAQG